MSLNKKQNTAFAASSSSSSSSSSFGDAVPSHQILADVIRSAELAEASVERRTKFIKSHLDRMDDAQLTRFEFFVRSHLNRGKVKKVLQAAASQYMVTDDMAIVAGGLAKLFVGELVETALDVMRERAAVEAQWLAESGHASSSSSAPPRQRLTVEHLQEAYRRMQNEGKVGRASLHGGIGLSGAAGGALGRSRLQHGGGDLEAMCAALAAEEGLDLGDLQAGQDEEAEEEAEAEAEEELAEVTEEEMDTATKGGESEGEAVTRTSVAGADEKGDEEEETTPAVAPEAPPSGDKRAAKRRRT